MEKIDYLKKGEQYEFIQSFNKIGKIILVVFDKIEGSVHGCFGGYITRDKNNVVHVWNSENLDTKIDFSHMRKYIERRNLEIRIE